MDFRYVAFVAVFIVFAAGAVYFVMDDSGDGEGEAFFKDPDDLVVGDYVEFSSHLSTESERQKVRMTVTEVDPDTFDLKVKVQKGSRTTTESMTAEEFIGMVNLRGGLYQFTSSSLYEIMDTCDGKMLCDLYQVVRGTDGELVSLYVRPTFDVIHQTNFLEGDALRYLDLVDTSLYDRTPE